ncbi:MAG: hypothetical protein JNM80_10480 [Phycisphaerae bacterium]|nr:hypothetical protein [Phycisphaerae bacterium]
MALQRLARQGPDWGYRHRHRRQGAGHRRVPALEWVLERYQVTVDKDSGIRNDPNDWAKEHKQPRYIIDLVKRVVRVSVETVMIVKTLPALNERT